MFAISTSPSSRPLGRARATEVVAAVAVALVEAPAVTARGPLPAVAVVVTVRDAVSEPDGFVTVSVAVKVPVVA
jgi:hypothetical protein